MIFPSENSRLKLKDYFINNCFGDVISLICFECFQTWITRVCLCRHTNQTDPLAVQSRQTLLITVSKCFKKLKLIYKICNRLERNYNVKIVIAKCFFFFCQNSLIIFLDHCKPTVFSVLPEYKLSSISHKSQF